MEFKENLNRFAVYFNNECIGEATSFKVVKGAKRKMPFLAIKGINLLKKKE